MYFFTIWSSLFSSEHPFFPTSNKINLTYYLARAFMEMRVWPLSSKAYSNRMVSHDKLQINGVST